MKELIASYKELFSGRGYANEIETLGQLEAIIKSELLDELTHPRLRKKPDQKLELAYERIENCSLSLVEKQRLKTLYKEVYDSVNSF